MILFGLLKRQQRIYQSLPDQLQGVSNLPEGDMRITAIHFDYSMLSYL